MRAGEQIAHGLTGILGPGLFRLLGASLKYDIKGQENQESNWEAGEPVVFVTWHGRLLPLLYLYRGKGLVALVSQHRDGEYLARVGRGLGFDTVRGNCGRANLWRLRPMDRRARERR